MQRASFRHIKGVSYDLKIGLIDVDSHNFPNLCLMKLSAYHKAKGHTVEWWNAKGRYDLVYKSRVFTDTYSKDTITVTNAEQVIFGGTGYDTKNRLPPEVEHSYPDYSIYPQFFGIAYGFLEEENIVAIYAEDSRETTLENILAAMPYMDEDMRQLAAATVNKLQAMTDSEFSEREFILTDEE